MDNEMIAVGSVPLNTGMLDYADAEGKIILWVRDEREGRSLYITFEMYGEISRAYSVRYEDFADVVTKVMGDVTIHNMTDPFEQLLIGAQNG